MTAEASGAGLTTAIPSLQVQVDGRAMPDDVLSRLVAVRVAARLSQPAQCELTFVTWHGSAAEDRLCPLGARLVVRAYGDTDPLFSGEVTAFELDHAADGTASLRIRAYDQLHRLRKRRRAQVHESVTAAELARALTDLPVSAEQDGPRLERVVHHQHHDFELLVAVANGAGLHPVMDGDTLRLITLEGYGEPVPLVLGASLLQVRVEANLEQATDQVTALGWHPQRAEVIEQQAGKARSGRRIPLRPDPGDVGGERQRLLVERSGRSEDEVLAAAQAALDINAAAAVTVSGVAEGSGRLRPGARVEVTGVARSVAGVYVLTEVTHTVDAGGYLTRFSTQPPRPVRPQRSAILTLGRVTEVEDPDGYGRVRVRLPAYGDLDVGWLGVLCAGAGPGRGLVALPDVDDTILVALPHGEPAAGIVLGGLYGIVKPPDTGIDGGRVRRWSMQTAGGQSLIVDDKDHRLRLQNKAGSYVELTPDLMRVHAASDLVIQAPGHGVTIRAASVDFVHAPVQTPGGG